MALPVRTITRSALLDGQQNGKLDSAILLSTPGQANGATVILIRPAARAWRAMCAAVLKAGHTLKATSVADSYRIYEIQERIFRERYTTSYLAGRPYRYWNGRRWYQRPGTAVAAVPGTSNHGWAQAVDTGEERDGDSGAESLDDPTLQWLIDHAQTYGWSHEIQSEPWHLHYFAGDRVPAAVLAYEREQEQEPPEEDDDMASQIVWYTDPKDPTEAHAYQVFGSGIGKHLTPGGLKLARGLGVKEVNKGKPFGADWRETVALLDGPCKSV